jgi:hypothetical protein
LVYSVNPGTMALRTILRRILGVLVIIFSIGAISCGVMVFNLHAWLREYRGYSLATTNINMRGGTSAMEFVHISSFTPESFILSVRDTRAMADMNDVPTGMLSINDDSGRIELQRALALEIPFGRSSAEARMRFDVRMPPGKKNLNLLINSSLEPNDRLGEVTLFYNTTAHDLDLTLSRLASIVFAVIAVGLLAFIVLVLGTRRV